MTFAVWYFFIFGVLANFYFTYKVARRWVNKQ
jgi:hypothetical protein